MFIFSLFGDDCLAEIHPEHAHIIEQTKANMPSEEILEKTAEVFKVFGDKTRIRILAALSEGEMCVCCLCDLLEMSQSAIRMSWTAEEVDQKLKGIMSNIHEVSRETAKEFGEPDNYVMGANIAAFRKVADAMIDLGI